MASKPLETIRMSWRKSTPAAPSERRVVPLEAEPLARAFREKSAVLVGKPAPDFYSDQAPDKVFLVEVPVPKTLGEAARAIGELQRTSHQGWERLFKKERALTLYTNEAGEQRAFVQQTPGQGIRVSVTPPEQLSLPHDNELWTRRQVLLHSHPDPVAIPSGGDHKYVGREEKQGGQTQSVVVDREGHACLFGAELERQVTLDELDRMPLDALFQR